MNENIIFWTHAYNSEKTICRAVESILGQTYGDFTYYLLDNGSNDATGEIIRKYAQKDSRIVPLYRKENLIDVSSEYLPYFLSKGDEGYLAWLDADDAYSSDFLKKMLTFVTQNNLDVAICGTEHIELDGSSKFEIPPRTFTLEGAEFAAFFPEFYKFTTRLWAGLYSLRILPDMDMLTSVNKGKESNFGDCRCALNGLRSAKRAGILSECLHKYYKSPEQLSKAFNPRFFESITAIQDQARQFLLSFGPISKQNENFLWIRYLIWLKNILPRIQDADVSLKKKLEDIYNIFSNERTKMFLNLDWKAVGIYQDKKEFLCEIRDWILAQNLNDDKLYPLWQKINKMLETDWYK